MSHWTKAATALLLSLGSFVSAQPAPSPRAEFKSSIDQLQKTPDDAALRKKIIKLARSVKPAPAVPEEARRFLARGAAAFESAKTDEDYKLAIPEFQNAANKAPWWGDAYFNLAKAQEKAGDLGGALANYRWCLAADPEGKDAESVRTTTYKLEFKAEQKAKAEAASNERKNWSAGIVRNLQDTYGGLQAPILHQCMVLPRKSVCDDQDADGNNWRLITHQSKPTFSVEDADGGRIGILLGGTKFCGNVRGGSFDSVEWTYCGPDVNELRSGSAAKITLDSWSGKPGILAQYFYTGVGSTRQWFEFAQ
jgi:hypothetical protein